MENGTPLDFIVCRRFLIIPENKDKGDAWNGDVREQKHLYFKLDFFSHNYAAWDTEPYMSSFQQILKNTHFLPKLIEA